MPVYVIRYDTWTVEKVDSNDIRHPEFLTELDAEETIEKELSEIHWNFFENMHRFHGSPIDCLKHLYACRDRIQKLKQQSGNLQK